MNFEGWVYFTLIECCDIQLFIVSMDASLLFQSFVLQAATMFLKSSISWGSTGFDTEACLFLNAVLEDPVAPKPFDAP